MSSTNMSFFQSIIMVLTFDCIVMESGEMRDDQKTVARQEKGKAQAEPAECSRDKSMERSRDKLTYHSRYESMAHNRDESAAQWDATGKVIAMTRTLVEGAVSRMAQSQ